MPEQTLEYDPVFVEASDKADCIVRLVDESYILRAVIKLGGADSHG